MLIKNEDFNNTVASDKCNMKECSFCQLLKLITQHGDAFDMWWQFRYHFIRNVITNPMLLTAVSNSQRLKSYKQTSEPIIFKGRWLVSARDDTS